MENKQTAVDYLYAKMEALRGLFLLEQISYTEFVDEKYEAYKQAKKMEKEQICFAFLDGKVSELDKKPMSEYINPVQYYRQTYGKETDNN